MLKRSLHPVAPAPGRLVAAGTGLVAVTYGVVRYGYGLQLPTLTTELGLSSAAAGAIAAGSFAAYCAAALGAQRAMARRSPRAVVWAAAALAAAGAVLVGLSWSSASLAAGVLVAGSAAGAASPALVAAVGATVDGRRAGRMQAVVNSGTGVGVALVGAATLVAPDVWRPVWCAAAVGAVVTAAVVDRSARWPAAPESPPASGGAGGRSLGRAGFAAAVAGIGSAAVWTFGRDLVTVTGGLPGRTTAALWCLLGVAAVLGALSGDAVRVLGLRGAWVVTAVATAVGTAALALAPGSVPVVAVAGALFGAAYTALSGVLIAWGTALRPHAAGRATAALFVALTAGQAVGALATGGLSDVVGPQAAFWVGAALLLVAAGVVPRVPDGAGPGRQRADRPASGRTGTVGARTDGASAGGASAVGTGAGGASAGATASGYASSSAGEARTGSPSGPSGSTSASSSASGSTQRW
ncbi:YbfB/YjiJ family MFS transporter [Cellulosimicrobium funkei]|uniref:MFS transporter n=1 Tax=Cellulosimicrobium funkei TaxID=264251 RepID=A0A4Y8QZD7_9MICO|nr:YbfB/YjiJ family MFS transporter [Cellulosimicrobium funkei]TFF05166.1 MFS transporter [Cellulosimicrobium funkei]TGA69561.1 MFS transporter [Cellulosimicrobium terreum]